MVPFQRAVLSLTESAKVQLRLGILYCPCFLFLSEILKCSRLFTCLVLVHIRRVFSVRSFPVDSCK